MSSEYSCYIAITSSLSGAKRRGWMEMAELSITSNNHPIPLFTTKRRYVFIVFNMEPKLAIINSKGLYLLPSGNLT